MPGFLKQSTASQSRALGPFVDDTDFKTPETGLTIANTDIKLVVNGGASANKNSGGGTHRVNGVYGVTFDATDTATVGEMEVSVVVSGALPVFDKFFVVEEAVYDMLFAASALGYIANAPVNVAQFGGSNGTFSGGRPEVNTSHAAGTAWNSGAIGANTLASDTITAAKIATGAIDADAIADNAIDAGAIAADAITSAKIADNAITANKIASDAITAAKIATGAIDADAIADNAIDAGAIAANAITDAKIATGAITAAKFAAGAIDAAAIADGAIDAATFAAGAITATVIADNAIDAGAIASDAITSAKIADGAITAAKIATGAIDADALAADAVAEIADGVWDEAVDGATTARESIRLANSANGAKLSGAATSTVTIRDLADSKDRVTATVDADGNRTAVSRDLT